MSHWTVVILQLIIVFSSQLEMLRKEVELRMKASVQKGETISCEVKMAHLWKKYKLLYILNELIDVRNCFDELATTQLLGDILL